ncbi:hypothetical protein [Streptomyces sp. NPDC002785]|uniref:hypothetical protein n=1 Tax=Streptomyces sp. NPDC002785 TaxID=3154543 RepID=UPI00331E26C5
MSGTVYTLMADGWHASENDYLSAYSKPRIPGMLASCLHRELRHVTVVASHGAAAWGDPDNERPGRPWEEIHWYTRDEAGGGYKEVNVPKPDISEIKPDLSNLPAHLR